MTSLSARVTWIWLVHNDNIKYSPEVYKARDYITSELIPALIRQDIFHEFVYDPVAGTINIVIPREVYTSTIGIAAMFRDAKFEEREIPLPDGQQSADLREAILKGSNFNKKWH